MRAIELQIEPVASMEVTATGLGSNVSSRYVSLAFVQYRVYSGILTGFIYFF